MRFIDIIRHGLKYFLDHHLGL